MLPDWPQAVLGPAGQRTKALPEQVAHWSGQATAAESGANLEANSSGSESPSSLSASPSSPSSGSRSGVESARAASRQRGQSHGLSAALFSRGYPASPSCTDTIQ